MAETKPCDCACGCTKPHRNAAQCNECWESDVCFDLMAEADPNDSD